MRVFLLLALALFILIPTTFAQEIQPQEKKHEAEIVKILEEKEIEVMGKKQLYQKLELDLQNSDENITLENGNFPVVNVQKFRVGDNVMVSEITGPQGNKSYYISDFIRKTPLFWLFAIFAVLTVLVGKKRGLMSLIGMAGTFLVIFYFILPQISSGNDPILISILASAIILPATLYLSHGINKKTHAALLGTFLSLVITGILANLFVEWAKLTGFASEEAGFLQASKQGLINIRGLLLAGIIIGVLGILDDVTVAQASVVAQLKKTSTSLKFGELYKKAMEIGRDHIASVVNTLVLVYTGAALPLLLLFIDNPAPFGQTINQEIIAEEVVRTLVASIGLILAVPITTVISAYIFSKKRVHELG